ncbi:MAG: hypothetical protein ACOC9W_00370, partial [Persicimonas sp.]
MGDQPAPPFESKVECPQCQAKFRLTASQDHLPAVVLCPRCQNAFPVGETDEDAAGAQPFEPNPEFARAPSEDTPVVQLTPAGSTVGLEDEFSSPIIVDEGLGATSSAGGFTDEELEDMDDFARSLRADPASSTEMVSDDPSGKASQRPPALPDIAPRAKPSPSAKSNRSDEQGGTQQALRERLEQILNEGLEGFSHGDQPPPAIEKPDGESNTTLRGLPVDKEGNADGKRPGAGMASRRRGSGFIVLPTQEIRDAFGQGVYMLRIAGEEFGPVDQSGVVTLIKHGAVMAADEIAEPGGGWTPILDHPGIVRLRAKMAREAHRVLKGLDVRGRRIEKEPDEPTPAPSPASPPPPEPDEPSAAAAPVQPVEPVEPTRTPAQKRAKEPVAMPSTRVDPV